LKGGYPELGAANTMGDYGGVKRRRERCENLTAPVPIRFLYSQLAIYECTGQRVPYEHLCSRALAGMSPFRLRAVGDGGHHNRLN